MDFESANLFLDRLFSYEKLNNFDYKIDDLNLNKVRAFIKRMQLPLKFPGLVHVAGSKGKGSTCKLISDYLVWSGKKVGLFVSPHLLDVRERMMVNGEIVSEQKFADLVEWYANVVGAAEEGRSVGSGGDDVRGVELTYFEVMLVLALKLFEQEEVEFAVFEVGLGGRLDATNVLQPDVTALSFVEREHVGILGETVEEILGEKMGIMKQDTPMVVGCQSEQVEQLIQKRWESDERVEFVECRGAEGAMERNVALAEGVLTKLLGKVDKEVFTETVRVFSFVGRCEIRKIDGKKVVFDMAHTENSVKNLVLRLKKEFPGQKFTFLMSFMRGKDVLSMWRYLLPLAGKVVFTNANLDRGYKGEELFVMWREKMGSDVVNVAFNENCEEAFEHLIAEDGILVVVGSAYLVGKILNTQKSHH